MRPIDTIREKIDSDLSKYHQTNLCTIDDDSYVQNIVGIGVCAIVRMFDNNEGGDALDNPNPTYFPVLILNSKYGYMEQNVSKKYNVLLLSTVAERTSSLSVGFLVSKTAVSDVREYFSLFMEQEEDRKMAKEASMKSIVSKQETNHVRQ